MMSPSTPAKGWKDTHGLSTVTFSVYVPGAIIITSGLAALDSLASRAA